MASSSKNRFTHLNKLDNSGSITLKKIASSTSLVPESDVTSGQHPILDFQEQEHNTNIGDIEDIDSNICESPDSEFGTTMTEESKSVWYLICLTLAMGGLQIAWSVELSSISPFLLSLGLSKSLLALIWIAGPLAGAVVQPYVGIKSDNLRSRWGRRRPFIIGGALATGLSLLALAWTRDIVGTCFGIFGVPSTAPSVKLASQLFAALLVYVLDFSINVIQAGIRALIVDCAPTHQQEDANAYANRLTAAGNIIGYLAGYIDLPRIFPVFGNTHFKVLSSIACLTMAITISATCYNVTEHDSRRPTAQPATGSGIFSTIRVLVRCIHRLPPQVKHVCLVQIFAWIGWFPFLFYITTYVGGVYAEPFFLENPNMTEVEIDQVLEQGTRVGAFALLVFAITTFAASVILPWIIVPTYRPVESVYSTSQNDERTLSGANSRTTRCYSGITLLIGYITPAHMQISFLTLRKAWLISHVIFIILMWLTFFVKTTTTAIGFVGAIGVPWALTNWAPFALISAELSEIDAARKGLRLRPLTPQRTLFAEEEDEQADQAGVVLGIHNVAIAAPQILATLMSSVIFSALQKPRGSPGDDSIAWVLRIGSLWALGAAWCTRYVQ